MLISVLDFMIDFVIDLHDGHCSTKVIKEEFLFNVEALLKKSNYTPDIGVSNSPFL